jgi:hypothetical protein
MQNMSQTFFRNWGGIRGEGKGERRRGKRAKGREKGKRCREAKRGIPDYFPCLICRATHVSDIFLLLSIYVNLRGSLEIPQNLPQSFRWIKKQINK